MIDYFNLPNTDKNFQIFYGIGEGVWQTWQKPRGCKFVQMMLIGGGGGGSSGQTLSTGTRLGGGGGGGSAISRAFYQSNVIPDTLYILVGMGGQGQTLTSNGTSGGISYVTITPTTASTANIFLASGAVGATCSNGNGAGSAGTIFAQTGGFAGYLGLFTAIAGTSGFGGGTNASPGVSITVTNITTGGAGGGSIRALGNQEFDGGGLNGTGFIPQITGTTAGLDGLSSPFYSLPSSQNSKYPTIFVGGTGGGSKHAGNAGRGGDGSYGCGGGGGGGGTTGGSGGKGGNGLVIITCW